MILKLPTEDSILLEEISRTNSLIYNKLKLVEELQELATVLVQKETKPKKVDAKDPEAEEKELADVLIRLELYLHTLNSDRLASVQTHCKNKLKTYRKWFDNGTYNQI